MTTLAMPSVHYLAILPILVLLGGSLGLMLAAAMTHGRISARFTTTWTALSALASVIVAFFQWHDVAQHGSTTTMAHAIAFDGFSVLAGAVISVAVLLTSFVAHDWIARARVVGAEFHILLLAAAAGAVMMASANDLIVVFLGLETLSIGLYVMVAFDRHRASSAEAALKYLLLGGFASALFIYGAALLYGGTGSTTLTNIGYFLAHNYIAQPGVVIAGLALIIVGFGFKVAAVPFHNWSPDVYEGAPSPVTGFMAAVVKVGAFAGVLRIVLGALATQAQAWRPVIAVLIILSTFVGAILALVQSNVKRLLAYSSINHAGFMLLGLWSATPTGVAGTLYYVMTYAPVVVASFAVITLVGGVNEDHNSLENLRGLARRQPLLGGALAVLLLSQAGAPFTTGFFAKFAVVRAAIDNGGVWIGVLVMIAASIAGYFYVRTVLSLYDSSAEGTPVPLPRATALVITLGAASAVLFGVWPTPLESLAHHATLLLP